MAIKDCLPILSDTPLDAQDIIQTLEDLSPITDAQVKQKVLREEISAALDEKIKKAKEIAHDNHIGKSQVQQYTDGAGNYQEILDRRMNDIFGRNSIDTVRRNYRNRHINQLDTFEAMFGAREGIRSVKPDSDMEKQVSIRVMQIGEIKVDGLTAKSAAKMLPENASEVDRIAYAIAAYNEWSRQFMIKHGVDVKYHDQYFIKRRYDTAAMDSMGAERYAKLSDEEKVKYQKMGTAQAKKILGIKAWSEYMADNLDAVKTYGHSMTREELVENLERTARKIYENNVKGKSVLEMDNPKKAKRARKREFVFKSPEHAYDVFQKTSVGGLTSQIESNAWAMASEAVKISRLGIDHKRVDKLVTQKTIEYVERLPDEKRTHKPRPDWWKNYKENRIKQGIADLAGDNTYARSGLSDFSTFMKTALAVGKLGNTITVAMLDPLDTGRQAFYVNGKFFGGLIDWHRNMIQVIKQTGIKNVVTGNTEKLKEISTHLGLVSNFLSAESSMRVARGDLATSDSFFGKQIDRFGANLMKLTSLLPQQTALSKISSGMTAVRTFTNMVEKLEKKDFDLNALNAFELDTLREYNISAKEMRAIAMAERFKPWGDGSAVLTHKSIRDSLLNPEGKDYAEHLQKLSDILGVEKDMVGDAVINMSEKYANFVNDFFSRGTPTPELSVKTAMFKATGSETLDVVMNLMGQFMDTPIMQLQSYAELVEKMKRLHSHPDQTVAQTVKQVGVPMMAQMVPHALTGAAMYLAYDAIWSELMGKEQSKIQKLATGNPTQQKEVMLDVLGRTSVVPFMFEAINNGTSSYYNGSVLDMFGGPAVDVLNDAAKVINPNSNTTLESFAKKQLPNAWFIQAIQNRISE